MLPIAIEAAGAKFVLKICTHAILLVVRLTANAAGSTEQLRMPWSINRSRCLHR